MSSRATDAFRPRAPSARVVPVVLVLMAFMGGAAARAETIDATLTTLLSGRADPRDGRIYTIVPAYQAVSLLASDLKLPGFDDLRVVMTGWGELVLNQPQGSTPRADLDLGYVEGALWKRRIELRLGRQIVFGGAARAIQMDGLVATARGRWGLGLTGYGGVPVTPRFGTSRGDAMFGGRAFWRANWDGEIGVSFLQINHDGRIARQDLAVDGRYGIGRTLALTALGRFSTAEMRIAEVDVNAMWQPKPIVTAMIDFRRTAPDLFLPRTSIFAVFSQETRDEAGASIDLRLTPAALRLRGDYHLISVAAGFGHRAAVKLMFNPDRSLDTTLGLELRALTMPENGYYQGRLFGIRRLGPKLFVTLDVDVYYLEREIRDTRLSVTAAASAAWDFSPGWRLVATGIVDSTPLVERRVEGMLKLVYNHTLRVREVKP